MDKILRAKQLAKYKQYIKYCNEGLQEESLTEQERVELEEAKEMYKAAVEELEDSSVA